MANYVNKWIKRKRQQLVADRGGECEECGSKEKMEFAHLGETGLYGAGRGRKERYYDVIRNPDKYKLLCQRCHKRLDTSVSRSAPPTPFLGVRIDRGKYYKSVFWG